MPGLVCAPFLWPPTHLSHILMRQVSAMAREVKVLDGPMNVRWVFEDTVRSLEPGWVFYGGHGEPERLVGEDIVVGMLSAEDVRRKPALVRGRIVVALPCCHSAKALGPACIEAGARAYLGATDVMYAAFDDEEFPYFSEAWMDYMKAPYVALLSGKTVGEALRVYQERARHWIGFFRDHLGVWSEADWHMETTQHNLNVVTLLGDASARI
jgi:hypothetical protein